MEDSYIAPTLTRLGSVHDLTLQRFNKIGVANDVYTALTNGAVVGSLVPVP